MDRNHYKMCEWYLLLLFILYTICHHTSLQDIALSLMALKGMGPPDMMSYDVIPLRSTSCGVLVFASLSLCVALLILPDKSD